NEVQVGGYAATRADFDIPARYGVRQTIGDTLGIGGIFRGLRTIPVTVALARDMAEVCPDAYLLSYSNPMAMLPWAVYEGSPMTRWTLSRPANWRRSSSTRWRPAPSASCT